MIRLSITRNYEELSKKAATVISEKINQNNSLVLGLATGGTPLGMYQELVKYYQEGKVSFKNITSFNLDEYVGLGPDNQQSYSYYMNKNFFSKVDVSFDEINIPKGVFKSENEATSNYDKLIRDSGGIDLQILGIGKNGHIGFNEPSHTLKVNTHIVELEEETIEANARFFDAKREVPRKAISMGMGQIIQSKEILLLVAGIEKAEALTQTLSGEIKTDCPSTFLQLHPNVVILADEEASSKLNNACGRTSLLCRG